MHIVEPGGKPISAEVWDIVFWDPQFMNPPMCPLVFTKPFAGKSRALKTRESRHAKSYARKFGTFAVATSRTGKGGQVGEMARVMNWQPSWRTQERWSFGSPKWMHETGISIYMNGWFLRDQSVGKYTCFNDPSWGSWIRISHTNQPFM